MDTKLTKFPNIKGLSIAVYLLTVVLICAAIYVVMHEARRITFHDCVDLISRESYTQSRAFNRNTDLMRSQLRDLALNFKSEAFILSGGTVNKERVQAAKTTLFNDKRGVLRSKLLLETGRTPDQISDRELYAFFEQEYAAEIDKITSSIINEDLSNFRKLLESVNTQPGMYYGIVGEDCRLSNAPENTPDFFEYFDYNYQYQYKGNNLNHTYSIYLAYQNDFIQEQSQHWNEERDRLNHALCYFTGLIFAVLLGLFYLCRAVERKDGREPGAESFVDRIYTEFILVAQCIILAVIVALLEAWWSGANTGLIMVWTGFFVALELAGGLLLVKHLKNRDLLKHTFCFVIMKKIINGIGCLFASGPLMRNGVLAVVVLGLLTMVPMVGIITVPLAIWFTYRLISKFNQVLAGSEAVRDGCYHTKISIPPQGSLGKLAQNINQIADGLNTEVESRIKSERLKTELISNVSHDIRTPLTSVITYVDLLKQEEIENDKAAGYIDIIDQKSSRLKVLIDDLFEASKITSGSIPVNLETVDFAALLRQGLGELDDRLESSGLDLKLNIPQEKVLVHADGKMLWRAVENILSNVFKYALPKSRVYIDLLVQERQAELEIKNISAYELNIPEDELLERFKRGDESRHSEGSGLGLSIAKSLMINQQGYLSVKIDGDLFKVVIVIPRHLG